MSDKSRQSRRTATARLKPCLDEQRRVAVFATHSLRVAAKKASGGVAKPCRGATPAAFCALPETFLTRNARSRNGVNAPLAGINTAQVAIKNKANEEEAI
jgi:hypothetical protein